MTRILRAPAATEEPAVDINADSPNKLTAVWAKQTREMFNPPAAQTPPPAETKKEPDGKTDTGERRVSEQPAKPAVGGDTPPPASGQAGKGAETKPDAGKTAPKNEPAQPAAEDWETAPVPKGVPAHDFEAWKKGRKESETKLKAEIESGKTRLAEVEALLAESKKLTAQPGEIPADIKSKLESQENEIKLLRNSLMEADVTKDPRWKNHFEGGRARIIDRAKKIVGADRAEEIGKILALKDEEYRNSRLAEFIDQTESSSIAIQLNVQLDKLAQLDDEQAAEYQKIQDHNGTLAQEKQAKSQREEQERIASFNRLEKELTDPENGFIPYQRSSDPKWNAEVDKRIGYVKAILTGQGKEMDGSDIKPETIMRGAFMAAAMPMVLESYQASIKQWNQEKADLEAKIQTLSAAVPGPGGDVAEDADPTKIKLTPDMDPRAVVREFARKAAADARGGV